MAKEAGTTPYDSFAAVADYAPAMIWCGDAQGKCVYLNRAQRAFWGVGDGPLDSFSWSSTLVEDDAPKVYGPFADGMAKQQAFTCEARYLRADGAIRILSTRAEPRFDANGIFLGMVGVNEDVTEERRVQNELMESEARLRSLADNLPYGMVYQIVRDETGARRFSYVSSRCLELNGVSAEAAMAEPALLHSQILAEDFEAFTAIESAAFDTLRPFEAEARIRKPDGEVRWYKVASAPRVLADGSVVWDGVQIDIHDAKMAEERRQMLMREMSHRIKNNLSTVLSIATQTGRASGSYEHFAQSFRARLQALAQSHDMLMREERDEADLREILEAELRPYQTDAATERALAIAGDPIVLSGRAAVGMALVVHELATNAAKYGAYAGAGSIDVRWSRASPQSPIALTWRESGGPPVSPPARTGFGSRLIESIIVGELGGAVATRFTSAGFEADISFNTMAGEAGQ